MSPGPSFTMPTSSTPAPAEPESDPPAATTTEHRQPELAQLSAAGVQIDTNGRTNLGSTASSSDAMRRHDASIAQPKNCARCGQLLDVPPTSQDRQLNLDRAASSASLSAPSPSSYAFAPDSIRSQHRLQPHQSLTSAINAAAAVALARHIATDGSSQATTNGHAFCTQCAAQLAEHGASADPSASSASIPTAAAPTHTFDTQQQRIDDARQHGNSLNVPSTTSQGSSNGSITTNTASPVPTSLPQAQLTISVDNVGAGGDAEMTHSGGDHIHMHDPSAFPPLERAPLSPALRAPSSPPGIGRSTSRGRIRFADASTQGHDDASHNGTSSYALGRSGSFSRSLSYNGPGLDSESVSSSSAPVVVSFPPSNTASPASEIAPVLNAHVTHGNASSLHLPVSQLTQARSRSGSHLSTSGPSSHTHTVPAPAHAIPGGVKQRRPSSARRLSRSGSSTGPTTIPFAAVGAASGTVEMTLEDDPYGPAAVTRPRLSQLPTHVIAEKLYNAARDTRPPSLISASTSTLLAAASSQHAVGIEPSRAVKYHSHPFIYGNNPDEPTPMDEEDDHKTSLGLSANIDNVRWFDPSKPDPLQELSLLRTPPKSRGCLYPGATFNGTQRSGRNSYDVTVRIVNVDLEASHLCGYLNIRGLTEDWPELTTYFDAEIIGDRYGFVTGKWGATEADDLKHWARFPPFRPLRSALSKPGLRFNHQNKGFVFMRWKEKFLVPDHRVRDINGASFAGFYYVCVELGESAGRPPPAKRGRSGSNVSMTSVGTGAALSPAGSPTMTQGTAQSVTSNPTGAQWYAARTQRRRELSLSAPSTLPQPPTHTQSSGISYYHPIYHPHSPHGLAPSGPGFWPASPTSPHLPLGGGAEDPFANMWPDHPAEDDGYDDLGAMGKMSGFYFHENSEPYQQLSLHHTPEASTCSFEMR